MAGGFLLGVDLGTSSTVAVLRWPDGHTRPLLFDGAELLPSAVFVDAAGVPSVGRDAVRAGRADPGRYEPNPKRRIDEETVLLGVSVPVVELLAAVLRRVADEAVRVAGELPPAVVTVTSTAPGMLAGVVTVICVSETSTNDAGIPPMMTELVVVKPVPVIVTESPPVSSPESGVTAVIVGAGTYV